MRLSIRKQLYLAAVPLTVILILFLGSLCMRFFPLRDQVSDLRADLTELSLANDFTNALNQHATALAAALADEKDGKDVGEWGERLQRALDIWTEEKRDEGEAMEAIELQAVNTIRRDAVALRRATQRAMTLKRSGRVAEADALVAKDVWPLIASVSRAIDDRATQEGMEISQSLGVIQELTGSSYSPGSGRLHDEVQSLQMEVAAQIEASRLARAVILEQLAYRYAQFVGVESLDEAFAGNRDTEAAFTTWTYIMNHRSRTPHGAALFPMIQEQYKRWLSSRAEMLRQIRTHRASSMDNGIAGRLLALLSRDLLRSREATEDSVSEVVAAARQTLLTAILMGAVVMVGGLSIPAAIGRRTLRRITSLQDSTRRIREGHLDVNVEVGALDELGLLAASFNEMARDLERTAAAREQSDERFRHAARATNDVIWDWQIGPSSVWMNESARILLGLDIEAELSPDVWRELIHPDDWERVDRSLQTALEGSADLWSEQYRLRRSPGTWADVFDRAVIVRDAAARPVRVIGAMVDLTSQRISEQTIASLNRQRQLLLDSVGDAIVGIDPAGAITFVNHGGVKLLQTSADGMQGKHVHDVVHGRDSDHLRESCPVRGPLASGSPYAAIDDHFLRGNGTGFAAEVASNPVLDEGGAIVGGVICFRDVTEKRALERMKSEFVSTVSHELRTPLTSIRGALGLLASGLFAGGTQKGMRMLEIAVMNTDRLVRLINDILDVEKLDSGSVVMNQEDVEAGDLIRQAIEVMKPMADKAGVVLSCAAGTGMIRADPDRIMQTLTNLISNAIKFSDPGSPVVVRTKIELGMWQCEVRDEGRGIPADKLDLIFERFQQVDASDSRAKEGTGLGLPICRSIVQQHGGRIWVESLLDHGSRFFFTLPLAESESGQAAIVHLKPPVLVCDDDASIREILSAILAKHGYSVITAGNGEEALALAETRRPAAIVLDLKMNGMSGWETMARLRGSESTKSIPILLSSVYSPAEARALGGSVTDEADAYVQKPIEEQGLCDSLDRLVGAEAFADSILIVEDDEDLADVLREAFTRHGVISHCAATGAEAIELAGRFPPKLIVLDVHLPDIDAFGVVEWMRGVPDLRTTPLAVYSGQELSREERGRLRLGPTEFFTKSRISPEQFEKRVIELLKIVTFSEAETAAAVA